MTTAQSEATVRFFAIAWKRCARKGWCDEWGGMECHRVWSEWLAAGRPYDVWTFIRSRANIPAAPVRKAKPQYGE